MTDLYDHQLEDDEVEAPAPADLAALNQQHADLGVALAWLAEHWQGLPAPYFGVDADYSVSPPANRLNLQVHVGYSEATLADVARRLAVGAPLGAVTKEHDDHYVRVRRTFGTVAVVGWASRTSVCTRKVVGTRTEVSTAVSCQHCGEPIALQHDMWIHPHPQGGWKRECADGQTLAESPDLTEATTSTTEIIEWDCDPILAPTSAGAAG